MHTASGLLEELDGGTTLEAAEAQVLAYIKQHVREPGKAPLCGNSVGTDRGFLLRDMPTLESFLHYRIVDVSSVKELARRWFRGPTSTVRTRTATTGRWRTSVNPSRSCAITGRRSSCRSPAPTRTPRRRSPPSTSFPLSRSPRRSEAQGACRAAPHGATVTRTTRPRARHTKPGREHPSGPCTLFLSRWGKRTTQHRSWWV